MKTKNNRLRIYFLIAFGIPVILGIFMGIAYQRGQDVSAFPLVWMYLPATAVMAGALFEGEKKTAADGTQFGAPKFFYGMFSVITAVMVVLAVFNIFLSDAGLVMVINYLVYASSLISLIAIPCIKKDRREAYGLRLTKNWKWGLAGIGIFILIYLVLSAVSMVPAYLMGEDTEALSLNPDLGMWLGLVLPLNLLLSFTAFFGEEYGWRYYLQPVLQEKFGLKKGVIALGLLWGIWHLPINLFYYSPATSVQSILVQLAGCVGMGVFFGWIYMRTQNVWVVTVIHFLNNNLGLALFNVSSVGVERQWRDTVFTILLYLIVYLPFLLAKEYREK